MQKYNDAKKKCFAAGSAGEPEPCKSNKKTPKGKGKKSVQKGNISAPGFNAENPGI